MSVFTRVFNRIGGYDRLARSYPAAGEPPGARWDYQCVEFGGRMRYDWCVALIAAAGGLYVQARPPAQGRQAAILVPWRDIVDVRPVRLYWRRAVRLTCGTPAVGTITVWEPVWNVAAPLWAAHRHAGSGA